MDLSIFSLEGRVAIVTGAASQRGLGRVIALTLAEAGAHVVVCDINTEGKDFDLNQTADDIRKLGRQSLALKVDVTDEIAVKNMVGRVLQEFGTIDILVNNAAIGAMYDGMDTPQAIWDKMMNINARGVHNCCCAVSRVMIEKKKGAIVNINTVTSAEWAPRQYMYSVSKAAARHITTWLGRELIPYGIRVNAVAPGNINTKMSEHTLEGSMPFDHSMSFLSDKLKDIIPIGRVCEPVDVARVVLFLASDAAGYIAGQTIRVTGN